MSCCHCGQVLRRAIFSVSFSLFISGNRCPGIRAASRRSDIIDYIGSYAIYFVRTTSSPSDKFCVDQRAERTSRVLQHLDPCVKEVELMIGADASTLPSTPPAITHARAWSPGVQERAFTGLERA